MVDHHDLHAFLVYLVPCHASLCAVSLVMIEVLTMHFVL